VFGLRGLERLLDVGMRRRREVEVIGLDSRDSGKP
jgi:hypothetical protein